MSRTVPADRRHSPPIFLCGHRKSGTSMMLNLLDGHPSLATYPVDLALLYAYFPAFVGGEPDPEARRRRLRIILFDDPRQYLAKRGAADAIDLDDVQERFFTGLSDETLVQPGALIARLLAAYQAVNGPPPEDVAGIAVKETSVEIYAAEILDWFPEARFIQVMRDPRDVFAALAAGVDRHYGKLGEGHNETLASLLHRCRLGFRMAQVNQSRFGPARYRCVRFEDLVARPEETLRPLAAFLGIDFDPRLLRPTVLGHPTPGNNYEGRAMFEISNANANRWRERIGDADAQVIEFHLAQEMAAFGYDLQFSQTEQADAATAFYKWQNYRYFFSDRFA